MKRKRKSVPIPLQECEVDASMIRDLVLQRAESFYRNGAKPCALEMGYYHIIFSYPRDTDPEDCLRPIRRILKKPNARDKKNDRDSAKQRIKYRKARS